MIEMNIVARVHGGARFYKTRQSGFGVITDNGLLMVSRNPLMRSLFIPIRARS